MKRWQARKCLATLALVEAISDEKKTPRGKTRAWIKRRSERGYFNNIIRELRAEDSGGYKDMMRMSYEVFTFILGSIEPYIAPQEKLSGTKVVTAAERLVLTIRFLATGETYHSLSFQFRISISAISYIIRQVCEAIRTHLGPEYLKVPSTNEEWLAIAAKFEERWNFPNCLGAIDGKHIVIQAPPNCGSHYYNYKGTHSIVLMAVAGPDYECLYADVGTNGRVSDGGVWNKCRLAEAIENGTISLPPPKCLPLGINKVPHVFVGDDAFALKVHMMKPFPQSGLTEDKRVYNYRHSRARRISENPFGILASRWRALRSALLLPPQTVESVVLAAIVLHNYLRKSFSANRYCPAGLVDSDNHGIITPGSWRQEAPGSSLQPLQVPPNGHKASTKAKEVRDTFKEYFFNEGAVDWQWDLC